MQPEKDKLLIKFGQAFEANASGPLAIAATFVVACLFLFLSMH
jgi:hypothetical protein